MFTAAVKLDAHKAQGPTLPVDAMNEALAHPQLVENVVGHLLRHATRPGGLAMERSHGSLFAVDHHIVVQMHGCLAPMYGADEHDERIMHIPFPRAQIATQVRVRVVALAEVPERATEFGLGHFLNSSAELLVRVMLVVFIDGFFSTAETSEATGRPRR